MREIRLSGSEGGGEFKPLSLPLSPGKCQMRLWQQTNGKKVELTRHLSHTPHPCFQTGCVELAEQRGQKLWL